MSASVVEVHRDDGEPASLDVDDPRWLVDSSVNPRQNLPRGVFKLPRHQPATPDATVKMSTSTNKGATRLKYRPLRFTAIASTIIFIGSLVVSPAQGSPSSADSVSHSISAANPGITHFTVEGMAQVSPLSQAAASDLQQAVQDIPDTPVDILERRLQWQNSFASTVQDLRDQFPGDFSDAGMAPDATSAWVAFANATPPGAKEALAALPVKTVVTENVGWTEVELVNIGVSVHNAIATQVTTLQAVHTDPDTTTGRIRVTLQPKVPAASGTILARARELGDRTLEAKAGSLGFMPADANVAIDYRIGVVDAQDTAIYGGDQIIRCTSAFTVHQQGAGGSYPYGIVTAGHCDDAQSDGSYTLSYRGQLSKSLGDMQWNTTSSTTAPGQFYVASGTRRTATGAANPVLNGSYCRYGRTSGSSCSTVSNLNQCVTTLTYGTACGLAFTSGGTSSGGDSGGPWYSGTVGYGIHKGNVGSGLMFSPLWNALGGLSLALN